MMKLEDFTAEKVGMDWRTFKSGALRDVSMISTEGAVLYSIKKPVSSSGDALEVFWLRRLVTMFFSRFGHDDRRPKSYD